MLREPVWDVPEYQLHQFSLRSKPYAVCVFVLNEGKKFLAQLSEMQPLTESVDIIVADGGSSDGSTDLAQLASFGIRTLLVKTGEGKLSAQMRMALSYCLQEDYEGIITIDGNHKDDTQGIPLFVQAFQEGYDHLQGSRFVPGGKATRTPLTRWIGIRAIHAPLIRAVSGYPYTDTTNGFRGYSRRFLLDPRVAPFRSCFQTYELHYYLAVRAGELGFKVKEIPVTRTYPANGRTPTKIRPVSGNLSILSILLKTLFHRYDPSPEDHAE